MRLSLSALFSFRLSRTPLNGLQRRTAPFPHTHPRLSRRRPVPRMAPSAFGSRSSTQVLYSLSLSLSFSPPTAAVFPVIVNGGRHSLSFRRPPYGRSQQPSFSPLPLLFVAALSRSVPTHRRHPSPLNSSLPALTQHTHARLGSLVRHVAGAPRLWLLLGGTALLFLSLQAVLSVDLHSRAASHHMPPLQEHRRQKSDGSLGRPGGAPLGQKDDALVGQKNAMPPRHGADDRDDDPAEADDEPPKADPLRQAAAPREDKAGHNDIAHGKEMSLALRQKMHSGAVESHGHGEQPLPAGAGVVHFAEHKVYAVPAAADGNAPAAHAPDPKRRRAKAPPKPKLPVIPPLTLTDELRRSLGWTSQPVSPASSPGTVATRDAWLAGPAPFFILFQLLIHPSSACSRALPWPVAC